MKIRLDSSSLETTASSKPSSSGGGAASPQSIALGNDLADLSMEHSRVAALAAQIQGLPEIRQEKISALSDAIQNASYQVSPEQTADAMLTDFLGQAA